MQVLNLIRPEKSNITYNVTTFPDGEPHIALGDINRKDSVTVVCRIANPNICTYYFKWLIFLADMK